MEQVWSTNRDPEAPLVVIGSGIVGAAAAYHLLRLGARNVTLLDASELAGGSTPAGAGFVALWAAGAMPFGPAGLALERYGLEFYRELHTAGYDIGYRSNGNLVLGLSEAGWSERPARILHDAAASPGTRRLDPNEVAELCGVVDPSTVHGAVLMPSGIQLEAEAAVAAVLDVLREMGGRTRSGAVVTGFDAEDGVVHGVRVGNEHMEASGVVLAAGAWTNQVLSHLGAWLPLVRVVATRVVTEDIGVPPQMPTVQCPELRLWIRGSGGRFTWGTVAGYEPAYRFEATEGAIAPGRPRSERLLEQTLGDQAAIAKVFPPIAQAGVASWTQGLPVYTPDRMLIMDTVPGWRNVIVLAGDNETGISHGPGMGKVGAELMWGQETFADMSAFHADRFDLSQFPDEEALAVSLAECSPGSSGAADTLEFLASGRSTRGAGKHT